MAKSPDAFRTISEVAALLETPAHVLRFWESKFSQIKPVKGAGGRRYFRPDDIVLLGGIKVLLHEQGMTIRGVQKLLRERGPRYVAGLSALPWDAEVPEIAEDLPAPDCQPEPSPDPVIVGPWPGAVPAEEPAEEPRPGVMAEFVPGTLARLTASEAESDDEEPVEPAAPAEAPEAESGVGRLREALSRADAQRLREQAPRLAPLVARLVALREASSGQAG